MKKIPVLIISLFSGLFFTQARANTLSIKDTTTNNELTAKEKAD